jgi:hypothetical protein
MAKEATIKTELFASGYCEAHEKVVNPQKGLKKLRFYAVWALIHVPDLGNISLKYFTSLQLPFS